MDKSLESLCTNCGLCCMPNGKDCKHLQRLGNGTTKCKVYATRLGRVVGKDDAGNNIYCSNIMWTPDLYEGCPYNELKIAKWLKAIR